MDDGVLLLLVLAFSVAHSASLVSTGAEEVVTTVLEDEDEGLSVATRLSMK